MAVAAGVAVAMPRCAGRLHAVDDARWMADGAPFSTTLDTDATAVVREAAFNRLLARDILMTRREVRGSWSGEE